MKNILSAVAAIILAGCASSPQKSCYSKSQLFERIGKAIDGGKTQVVWKAGKTLGWKLNGVKEDAPIRRHGFKDQDLLARVCGLSIDEFAVTKEEICCSPGNTSGVALTFTRPDGSSYEVTA